jgi:hypothetical protein
MQSQIHRVRNIIASVSGLRNNDEKVKAAAQEIASLYGEQDAVTAQMPTRNDAENTLLNDLERGLKITIYPRTEEAYNIARKMIASGQTVETWLRWYKADLFRLQSMPYMTIVKVWQMWRSAEPDKPKPAAPVVEQEDEEYIPAPDYVRKYAN